MIRTELVYSLVSADSHILYAQAETLEGILNAAATMRDDGEDVDSMIVEHGGRYDPATTVMIQENVA